jgi:prophage regulatory protein
MLRILRRPDVERVTGLKKTRIDELERRGEFPQRVRISDRATGWRSDEVEAWVAARPRAADVPSDSHDRLQQAHAQRAAARTVS